jgi:predicted acylesterase/phospholipase RssA
MTAPSPQTPQPLDLQIAFQGGGARLALLIPVVEALRELEAEKKISIKRVSGTSAGAIAAALLAGNGNIPALLQFLRKVSVDGVTLEKIFPSTSNLGYWAKFRLGVKIFWNQQPIGDENALSELLSEALNIAGIDSGSSIGELDKPCFVVSVDLIRKDHEAARSDAKLVQALMDSAALPIFFRVSGNKMDGGILENLPIGALTTPETPGSSDGEIVAVAFAEPEFVPQARSPLEIGSALLDTMMTARTRASRHGLPANHVYDLPTKVGKIRVGSFDVQSFITFINDENACALVKAEAKAWFSEFIESKEQQRTGSGPAEGQIEVHQRLANFQTNLRSVAEHNFRHPTLHVSSTIFEVIAHSLEAPDDPKRKPDIVRVVDKVRVGGEPLFMHAAVLFSGGNSPVISRDYKVFDSNQRHVHFVAFDVPGETGGISWHLTIFLNPLPPSHVKDETYTIQQTYEVMDFMRPLHQNGADYLAQEFVQAAVTSVAEISLCVPKTLGPLMLWPGTPAELATLNLPVDALAARKRPLVEGKFQENVVVASCPRDYDAYVWRAEDCKRDEALRVVYRKGKRPD